MKELLLLSGLGIVTLVLEIFQWRKAIVPVLVAGLTLLIGLYVHDFHNQENLYNMLFLDRSAMTFLILISFLAICWFVFAGPKLSETSHIADHASLILFSMVGAFILVSYINMTMLFLGVEILSIPVYVLAGSDKRNIASNEASYKYFLMGAFASAFLLLGIALIYGATASFDIRTIAVSAMGGNSLSLRLLVLGMLLILFAMSFKASAVPFHFWAPDVYNGAPTPVTAYMATIVKVAALAAFFRLFGMVFGIFFGLYASILLVIAVLSVVLGNVLALSQDNVKRMLAYSGIGHAGFVLLAMATQQQLAASVVAYYLVAYSISAITAFSVLALVAKPGEEVVASFNGLVKRNPVLAGAMTLALLSMAGIPPLSGFFAKYFVLINVLLSEHAWAAIVAILASLVGVYYYFRIIIAMFFGDAEVQPVQLNLISKAVFLLLCLLIIGVGIYPEFIFDFVK